MRKGLIGLLAAAGVAGLFGAAMALGLLETADGTARPIAVKAEAVPLNPLLPAESRVGDFVYAGGLNLTAGDTDRLHGLSDLVVTPDGRLTSEGDDGELFTARLTLDGAGRLVGLSDTVLGRLKGKDGKPVSGKEEADAEGVAVWPNGDLMVSFERHHRIWLYPAAGGPPVDLPMPDDPLMTGNDGMEGLALAPSQGPDAYWVGVENGDIFLCRLAKACERKASLPRPPDTYRLAALTETPDGRLVILHDNFAVMTGARCRIILVSAPASDHPVVSAGFSLAPPQTTDNFEGVAAVPRPDGGLRLYLIVDDNFARSERTLLMAFDLIPAKGSK